MRAILAGLAASLAATSARAQLPARASDSTRVVVAGDVRDSASNAPLADVTVSVESSGVTAVTDERGAFVLTLAARAPRTIELRRIGYQSLTQVVDAAGRDTVRLTLRMARATPVLDTVAVKSLARSWSTKYDGFEHRRQGRTGGSFITRAQIEGQSPVVATDLLRRVLGVRVVDSMGVHVLVSSRGGKVVHVGNRMQNAPCVMRVGVDGQIKEWGYAVDALNPMDIYGVEVYSGPATIPRDFAGELTDSFCGLVMLWTR